MDSNQVLTAVNTTYIAAGVILISAILLYIAAKLSQNPPNKKSKR